MVFQITCGASTAGYADHNQVAAYYAETSNQCYILGTDSMAYDSRVYRILIASPSDVEDEREIVVRVIQEWNDLYSYSRKIVLLPLRWETHTAPEYGTRPQEVINRAIVDQCDLLVGIFWTRIGSPTGVAQSGTLEEIDRVGKSEKPVMLYFSRVAIDPERIDITQNEMLKQFKANTYPNGLIESYKTILEFRDKFAKQLELKVRDLQRSDASGELPLSLAFISVDKGELVGNSVSHTVDHPKVLEFDIVPMDQREQVRKTVAERIKEISYVPIALAIRNSSPSGIRNVYIELAVCSDSDKVEITDSPDTRKLFITTAFYGTERQAEIAQHVRSKLSRFDAGGLQNVDGGWRLSIEWEAIQPQRTRLIRPVLYVYAQEPAEISIFARVFGDSFPEPLTLKASVSIQVKEKEVGLEDLVPEWERLLQEKSLKRSEV